MDIYRSLLSIALAVVIASVMSASHLSFAYAAPWYDDDSSAASKEYQEAVNQLVQAFGQVQVRTTSSDSTPSTSPLRTVSTTVEYGSGTLVSNGLIAKRFGPLFDPSKEVLFLTAAHVTGKTDASHNIEVIIPNPGGASKRYQARVLVSQYGETSIDKDWALLAVRAPELQNRCIRLYPQPPKPGTKICLVAHRPNEPIIAKDLVVNDGCVSNKSSGAGHRHSGNIRCLDSVQNYSVGLHNDSLLAGFFNTSQGTPCKTGHSGAGLATYFGAPYYQFGIIGVQSSVDNDLNYGSFPTFDEICNAIDRATEHLP